MQYETSQLPPGQINEQLQVVRVDVGTHCVFVRSTAKELDEAMHQLNTEDAKALALQAGAKEGIVGAGIKHADIHYGDDKKCQTTRDVMAKGTRPFLRVQLHSAHTAGMMPMGDSL